MYFFQYTEVDQRYKFDALNFREANLTQKY